MIEFPANNPGVWAYHCHILFQLASGMFAIVKYGDFDAACWQSEKTTLELEETLPQGSNEGRHCQAGRLSGPGRAA